MREPRDRPAELRRLRRRVRRGARLRGRLLRLRGRPHRVRRRLRGCAERAGSTAESADPAARLPSSASTALAPAPTVSRTVAARAPICGRARSTAAIAASLRARALCQAGACTCVLGTCDELGDTFPQTVTGPPSAARRTTISRAWPPVRRAGLSLHAVRGGDIHAGHRRVRLRYGHRGAGSDHRAQLACNDDLAPGVGQSRVRAVLEAGQPVLVVVTGFDGGKSDFTLNAWRNPRRRSALGGRSTLRSRRPSPATPSTSATAIRPTCGAADSPDASYAFTAPAARKYVFDTFGSGFNTILELHDGACDGDVLTCSDDSGGGSQSRATVELSAGQKVVAVIDGFEGARGPYTLNVAAWAPPSVPHGGSRLHLPADGHGSHVRPRRRPPAGLLHGRFPRGQLQLHGAHRRPVYIRYARLDLQHGAPRSRRQLHGHLAGVQRRRGGLVPVAGVHAPRAGADGGCGRGRRARSTARTCST